MGLNDWHAGMIYYFNYDLNNQLKSTSYLQVLSNTSDNLKDITIELLSGEFNEMEKMVKSLFSNEWPNSDNFNSYFISRILGIFDEIRSLPVFNDFINNYGDIKVKEFNDTFDKIKNTIYSVSSSEMFERFNQKLNDNRIYNLLCKCFIPYIYQKFSSSSFSRDTALIKNSLSFLNLSIIGGIISLRNTKNNNKKYAQNIFSLNILMTNIERKIIFIYDEMTKLYRKFNVMKLVALGRGIILPNAFEMVLSLPAFDICKSCFLFLIIIYFYKLPLKD